MQYCVYTRSPKFREIALWLIEHKIKYEPHLNRTRFWIDQDSPEMVMFMLAYREDCELVPEGQDYTTGVSGALKWTS
jgi:hypothetical protein